MRFHLSYRSTLCRIGFIIVILLLTISHLYGQYQWAFQSTSQPFGSYNTFNGLSLVHDNSNGLYAFGLLSDCTFGSQQMVNNNNPFVCRIDPMGNVSQDVVIGIPNPGEIHMDATPGDGFVAAGVGGSTGTYYFSSSIQGVGVGGLEGYVARYDDTGSCIWARMIGTPQDEEVMAVLDDDSGNIYLAGQSDGNLIFDSNVVVNNGYFIMKLDSSGNYLWSIPISGTVAFGNKIVADEAGNIYWGGWFHTAIGIGSYNLATTSTNVDAFVCKISAGGTVLHAKQFGQYGTENLTSLAYGDGRLYAVGYLMGPYVGLDTMFYTDFYHEMFLASLDTALNLVHTAFTDTTSYSAIAVYSCDYNETDHLLVVTGNCGGGSIYLNGTFIASSTTDAAVFFAVDTTLGISYSRYLNGNQNDVGKSVVADDGYTAYVAGSTNSSALQFGSITILPYMLNNAFVTKYVHDVGIQEAVGNYQLQVYPVPASDRLITESRDGIVSLDISDAEGRDIKIIQFRNDQPVRYEMDISDLAGGCYLFTISTADGEIHTRKIMIIR